MTSTRHYSKAPITEAIFDLRVQPRTGLKLEELEQVVSGDEFAYPKREGMFEKDGGAPRSLRVGICRSNPDRL